MILQSVFIGNLKKFRKQKGLSQMKLAARCNTSTSYIGEIEIGNKFPSITMIEKIANALQIQPHFLFLTEQASDINEQVHLQPTIPEDIKTDIIQQLTAAAQKIIKSYSHYTKSSLSNYFVSFKA
jgi:transcriptional regulator with XRE-family HTH domain